MEGEDAVLGAGGDEADDLEGSAVGGEERDGGDWERECVAGVEVLGGGFDSPAGDGGKGDGGEDVGSRDGRGCDVKCGVGQAWR